MIANFDEIEWLTEFLDDGSIKTDGLERIRNFVFIWNLFEDVAMNKNANIDKLRQLVDQIHQIAPLDAQELAEFVEYFSNRYFDPIGQSPYSLKGLKFRSTANDQLARTEVQAVLTKNEQSPDKVLKALLLIVYRLRNNLFHGEKQVIGLERQVNNFIVANNVLRLTLEKMKALNMI